MPVKKGNIYNVHIEGIAYGGKGIARIDGFVIFVSGGIPGDIVSCLIVKKKEAYAEAKIVSLLEKSPLRIDPLCPYFSFCGGCQWLNVKYDAQLNFKKNHVKDSLEHIGLLKDVRVNDTIPSPNISHYRNKMEFSFSDRRWLFPDEMNNSGVKNNNFALGLHVPGSFSNVIDISQGCLLQHEEGNALLKLIREFTLSSGLPPYGLKSREGFWRFLVLRRSFAKNNWMINIVTKSGNGAILNELVKLIENSGIPVATIVNNITASKASIAVGERETILFGDGVLIDTIGTFSFRISANSFFQTNTSGAEILYAIAERFADLSGTETVIDLYSGTGSIPLFLSKRAKEVIGVEQVESAVMDAWRNCNDNDIKNCSFLLGDVLKVLPGITKKPDIITVDPPRAGMHKDVAAKILDLKPERIVYISCNPATLGRDLVMLSEKYTVSEVQPIDMFPHTYHIETVCLLEKN